MYIIEVFERKKWRLLKTSLSNTKAALEKEVEELNNLVSKEQLRELPVKEKYRIKKIKGSEGRLLKEELDKKRQFKNEIEKELQ